MGLFALTDRSLVQRALIGDRAAFDMLYSRHGRRVLNLLVRLGCSRDVAEDLTQETFLAAFRGLEAWKGRGAFGTWLCGIACKQYANLARRQGRAAEHLAEEPWTEETGADSLHFDPSGSDPLITCTAAEAVERMESAIRRLPSISREAFVLVKIEGFSYREAAGILAIPLGTLQSRLWRAVCQLQRELAPEPEVADARTDSPMTDGKDEGPCTALPRLKS